MNIHEYQAKELLQKFGVATPRGKAARTPDEAEAGMMQALATKQVVMGFGHPVYRISDPRSDIVKSWSRKLSASADMVGGST